MSAAGMVTFAMEELVRLRAERGLLCAVEREARALREPCGYEGGATSAGLNEALRALDEWRSANAPDVATAMMSLASKYISCFIAPPEDADDARDYDGPGWYFRDEAGRLHGPFATREEAATNLAGYVESL